MYQRLIYLYIYILKLEPILYRFRTVFHWNSSETKKYPLTYGLTASASPWNPCGTYNTHTRCLRGLSRKNSDNKRKITHALERLLHRGPCHVYVCASTVTFPRRLLYRRAFFGCRSSRRDKNARRGAERYRYKSICMWNDTCRHGRGVECELQQVNGTHNGNCACENRIVDEKGATKCEFVKISFDSI